MNQLITDSPTFSVIIPTHGRPQQLADCLQALTKLDYPQSRFEVIVVDDGSPIAIDSVIADVRGAFDMTLLKQSRAGPAAARNRGAAQAQGDYLAFTDDDCMPSIHWLSCLANRLNATGDQLVGGKIVNALDHNLFASASHLMVEYVTNYLNRANGQPAFFTTSNMALPAALFHAAGRFDESFPLASAEDREFCARWRRLGYSLTYAPDAVVHHAHRMNWRKYLRQHFNYGRGAYLYHRSQAQYHSDSLELEPIKFYFDLLRYPLTRKRPTQAVPLIMLLLLSQLAHTAGFAREAIGHMLSR